MPQIPCPYCGHPHDSADIGRCTQCNGLFEPLSQIATQLAMGPWYIRDEDRPFMPGFSEAILRQQVRAGRITPTTILRGPTTNQFWMNAGSTPGVSRLMGACHACRGVVSETDTACPHCQADLSLPDDVDALGLRYTTEAARADAQREIAEGRANPTPTPKSAPTKPEPKTDPLLLKKVQPAKPEPLAVLEPAEPAEPQAAYTYAPDEAEENDLASELAEDVWHASAASPSRRRRRANKGADPLVIGMGVLFLCVFALGALILLTSGKGGDQDDNGTPEQTEQTPAVERDSVAVSRMSVPALTAFERLDPDAIPEDFQDRYKALRRLVQQAKADETAERYNEAYDAYKELGELMTPLEQEIAQWHENELAKAEVETMLDQVDQSRKQADNAEAQRWAPQPWQEARTAVEQADKLIASGETAQAMELLGQAEAAYQLAAEQAQVGQAADQARSTLNTAITSSDSERSMRRVANDQVDALLRLRAEGDEQFNQRDYAAAAQSYTDALAALREAQRRVELARYKTFYAFDAGFRASGVLLAAARGDEVTREDQQSLAEAFALLGVTPNPASRITPGDQVELAAAVKPLVNDARDAITQRHGESIQACYLIGFHASIIDQSLKTKSLTDDQQKRIHQSLSTIEQEASKAGWNTSQLRPAIEHVRAANRRAKLNTEPEATRQAWGELLAPMRSKTSAPGLMTPSPSSSDLEDPELFPTNGS